jgi:hypothetical protein
MYLLETDLEEIIFYSDRQELSERGLDVKGELRRQLRIGNYGVADLVSFERAYIDFTKKRPFLHVTIYELKKDKIGISAFLQAVKYSKGIKSYLKRRKPDMLTSFSIVLIGSDVDNSGSMCYLPDLLDHTLSTTIPLGNLCNVDFYEYKYNLKGVNFQCSSEYNLINDGFNLVEPDYSDVPF